MKKNNRKITVNKAREIINSLDPSDRAEARIGKNDKRVAQIAEQGNNYWKA